MIKRLFGAAAVIACVSLAAWWFTYHRIAVEDEGLPVVSREDHRWLDGLYSRNPKEVQAATDEVTRRGGAALPSIQAALRDPRSEADRLKSALKACTLLGKRAAPAIEDVAAVLPEEGLTTEAAIALSHMGPGAFKPLRDGLCALRRGRPALLGQELRAVDQPRVVALPRQTERACAARFSEGHAIAAREHAGSRRHGPGRCGHVSRHRRQSAGAGRAGIVERLG